MITPNWRYLGQPQYYSIFLPLLIATTLICLGLFVSVSAALFPVLIFNFFHVTRQSVGVMKLYGNYKSRSLKTSLYMVYIFSIIFILIGILRFYFQWNISADVLSNMTTYSVLALAVAVVVVLYLSFKDDVSLTFVATVFTGLVMFMPLLFTESMEDAFAMGVGMHYAQYLAITIPLYLRMSKQTPSDGANRALNFVFSNWVPITIYFFVYASLMVFLASYQFFAGMYEIDVYTDVAWYLIPVTMQTLHFYADTFIWRFSNPHIRAEIYPFLFATTPSGK